MALLYRMSHTGAAASTSLVSGISPSATSLTLASAAGYPTGAGARPFLIVLDPGTLSEEKILCDTLTGVTVAVHPGGRGFDNTIATSHAAGAVVEHVLGAVEVDDANRHVYTPGDDDHTQYFPVNASRPVTGPAVFQAGITDTGAFTQTGPATINGNTHITGTLQADGPTTLGAGLTLTGDETVSGKLTVGSDTTVGGNLTVTGDIAGRSLDLVGLPGANAASRYVGATATAGPPGAGTFLVGDFVVDPQAVVWVCTTAGTPGTWTSASQWANPCGKASATAQTIISPDSTWTVLALVSAFTKGGVTFATNALTVPVAGVYRVDGATVYQQANGPVPAGQYAVAVWQQGANVAQGWDSHESATAEYPNPQVNTLLSAAAGDTFNLRGWKNTGGGGVASYGLAIYTYLTVELVSR